jgi:hypothetical protein
MVNGVFWFLDVNMILMHLDTASRLVLNLLLFGEAMSGEHIAERACVIQQGHVVEIQAHPF